MMKTNETMPPMPKKRVLILGGGFGGLHAAMEFERKLKKIRGVEVTLISRHNYSLFTPLLHEVATGELDPNNIVVPMHKLLKRVKFISGEIRAIDTARRKVTLEQTAIPNFEAADALEVAYDYLLLANGSTNNFFDLPGVEANALTMKSLTDAVILRNAVLGCLEAANVETDAEERARLLTFVIVGGGFAGVETIGSINDFAREAIKHYPDLDEKLLQVVLIHASDELLPEFAGDLSRFTHAKLIERAVDVRLKTHVTAASDRELSFENGEKLPYGIFVWTGGVKPDAHIENTPFAKEKGRILTDEFLQANDSENVWAIGDCAAIPNKETGGFYAPLAQNAQRQGATAARNILHRMKKAAVEKQAFKFKPLGQLASIGHLSGVANVLGFRFSGVLAWLVWKATYLFKLPTFEKKMRVLSNWIFNIFTTRDLVQFVSMDLLRVTETRKQKFFEWKKTAAAQDFQSAKGAQANIAQV